MTSPAGAQHKLEGSIRRYRDTDAEAVCSLHEIAFPNALPHGITGAQFGAHMKELTETNPWRTDELGPLVIEDHSGKVRGFHCIQPRRLRFGDRTVLGAVVSAMCIDPEFRGYAGAELLKYVGNGPQELAISDDANNVAAQVAIHTGSLVYQLQSIRWTLPLRPAELMLSSGVTRIGMPQARWIGAGLASLLDRAAKRLPQSPARLPVDKTISPRPMDIGAMAAALSRICRGYSLRVDYDEQSLAWMVQRARRMTQAGAPRMAMVCENDGSVAGWYIYYLKKRGLGDVVQFMARLRFRRRVFDWMVRDAWEAGAAGLTGRLDPDLMEIIANQYCLFQPHPHWVVVNTRNPEIRQAVLNGGMLLSRLDGEWSHHYPYTAAPEQTAVQRF